MLDFFPPLFSSPSNCSQIDLQLLLVETICHKQIKAFIGPVIGPTPRKSTQNDVDELRAWISSPTDN